AVHGETPSAVGLLLLTITYAGLLGVLAITERRRPGFQRSLTAVALAAFAVSALHLSRHAGIADQDPWPIELIGHHASLPLVLAILYQDYRFAFADLFLKRALSLLALVGVVALLYAGLAAPLVDPHAIAARRALNDGSHLFATEALLALWIATALAYPFIQWRVFRFVDRVVLRRADYRELRAELGRRLGASYDVDGALDVTCTLLARALGASRASWHTSRVERSSGTGGPTITLDARRTEACITIPTAIEPAFEILVDVSDGGRTLLSDDLMLIDAVAASVGRRIDELRLERERVAGEQREQEMRRLATEAELRALRAQLNPHFLFNALNTISSTVYDDPIAADEMIGRLGELLRRALRTGDRQEVRVDEELETLRAYLAFVEARFGDRLSVRLHVAPDTTSLAIPALLLQPLVENAVRHGSALEYGHSDILIDVAQAAGDLVITIENDVAADLPVPARIGTGLGTTGDRLRLLYGSAARLDVAAEQGRFRVTARMPARPGPPPPPAPVEPEHARAHR
ncbi:MAG: sensor histidine kinase, partial [bacterium]